MSNLGEVDLNGRDEETSMYIALLERQVAGLSLTNIRQRATIKAGGMAEGEFDLESAIGETVSRLESTRQESAGMNRRRRV